MSKSSKKTQRPVLVAKEIADPELIKKLLTSPKIDSDQKTVLSKYLKKIEDGYVSVKYFYSPNYGSFGRIYAEGGVSLQTFKRNIRHTLAHNNYYDVDMVNSQPTLISQYCEKNTIECTLLTDYVQRRDVWLKDIMNTHNIDRDAAKLIVLKICNLGNYSFPNAEYKCSHRCCVCLKTKINVNYLCNPKDVNDKFFHINVCTDCTKEYNSRENSNYDTFADMYKEKHNISKKEVITCYDLYDMLQNDFPPDLEVKNKSLVALSKEMRAIAKEIYNIEENLVELVEKSEEKINKNATVLTYLTHKLEHNCLMAIDQFFKNKKYTVGVYCFDGLMIESNGVPAITKELLNECCEFVFKKTRYQIKLEVKKMNEIIEIPDIGFVEDDKEVQERLFQLENPDYFKFCNEQLYIFNEKKGIFTTSKKNTSLTTYLLKHQSQFNVPNTTGKKMKNYGRDSHLRERVIPYIEEAAEDIDWLDETSNSSLHHLLFKNGIYNMLTGEFTEGFDPNIVFHARIKHKFPERNKADIKYARSITFDKMLDDPLPLIVMFARALTGDVSENKSFVICPGRTNAGKSKLVKAFELCFGSYVDNFDANSLAVASKNDTNDKAQKWRWAYLLRYKRIIFSSEASMKQTIDCDNIKKLSSAGDNLKGREHYQNEQSFVPHFIPFCMLNDVPNFTQIDDATYERLKYVSFNKQFVENPTEKHHVKADIHIEKKFKEQRFINGFIHLLLDAYQYYLKHGQPEFDALTKEQWTIEGRQDSSVSEVLQNQFEKTNNEEDFISVAEMTAFRKRLGKDFSTISPTRFNEAIQQTFGITQCRKGRDKVRGWKYLKRKELNDNDDFY